MHITGRGLETEKKRNPTDLGETANGPQRTPPLLNGPHLSQQTPSGHNEHPHITNGPQQTPTDTSRVPTGTNRHRAPKHLGFTPETRESGVTPGVTPEHVGVTPRGAPSLRLRLRQSLKTPADT